MILLFTRLRAVFFASPFSILRATLFAIFSRQRFLIAAGRLLGGLCLALLALTHATAQELRVEQNAQTALSLTIYNANLALVRDQRQLSLPQGPVTLAWRDVSAQMRPETALLVGSNGASVFQLVEQNFDFDLLSPQKLLEKYVGKTIRVKRSDSPSGAPEASESAEVLALNSGLVLRYADRIEAVTDKIFERLVFDTLPANLRDRPTLSLLLNSQQASKATLELNYLTRGLAWRTDYVAVMNSNEKALDLSAWVTLTNQSGVRYPNAKVQLVAGDVNQVREEIQRQAAPMMLRAAAAKVADEAVSEDLVNYRLYSLPRATTIEHNQTKQVALLSAQNVALQKQLLFEGQTYQFSQNVGEFGLQEKAQIRLLLHNTKEKGLGLALPKGIIRVYAKDAAGQAQFVGEDRIEHTALNERLNLQLGAAFDVSLDRRQTEFRALGAVDKTRNQYESAYRYTLRNSNRMPQTVTVREPIQGSVTVLEENFQSRKVNSQDLEWELVLPPEAEVNLTFRVRVIR